MLAYDKASTEVLGRKESEKEPMTTHSYDIIVDGRYHGNMDMNDIRNNISAEGVKEKAINEWGLDISATEVKPHNPRRQRAERDRVNHDMYPDDFPTISEEEYKRAME